MVINKIFLRHIWMLIFRFSLLVVAVWLYIMDSSHLDFSKMPERIIDRVFLLIIWIFLVSGMLARLFPGKNIAMGAKKHIGHPSCFTPKSNIAYTPKMKRNLHRGVFSITLAWLTLNGIIFYVLSLFDMLTPAIAIIIALIYAVCDIICILFFCPFKVLFMRNRCCTVCRIYNWDYIMICTPMLLFLNIYSASLILLAVFVLLHWEIAAWKKPHLFLAETNSRLRCEQCTDKLCRFNKPLL